MKTSIITLSLLATVLFASCSPEDEPQYDEYIHSPNTEHIEIPGDTIYKETFGNSNVIKIMALTDFAKQYQFDNKEVVYSSTRRVYRPGIDNPMVYFNNPEVCVMSQDGSNVIVFIRDTHIDLGGNAGQYAEYYGSQDLSISNIQLPSLEDCYGLNFSFTFKGNISGIRGEITRTDTKQYLGTFNIENIKETEGVCTSINLKQIIGTCRNIKIKLVYSNTGATIDNLSLVTKY